jgi:hypothetical protein
MLVVRIWREQCGPKGLRARVSRTPDVAQVAEVSTLAGDVDELLEIVREWVTGFAQGGDG